MTPLHIMFQITWGPSLSTLVGPEPADLEGALAPQEEAAGEIKASRAELDVLRGELARWLWSRNQFVSLGEDDRKLLDASLTRALRSMQRTGKVRPALRRHRRELAAFVRGKLGDEPREVHCAEYSPALQLEVLGLTLPLSAPILDVGCGPSAALVHHLRAQGLAASGLDRALDPAHGINADWLEHDYGHSRYGSALSHQGFSLHFLHHHHGAGDAAYAYARAYMAILRSLLPAGTFAYAPGLPFIEPVLDGNLYRVERVPFAEALRVPALVEVEQRTGLSFSYASHVTRI